MSEEPKKPTNPSVFLIGAAEELSKDNPDMVGFAIVTWDDLDRASVRTCGQRPQNSAHAGDIRAIVHKTFWKDFA